MMLRNPHLECLYCRAQRLVEEYEMRIQGEMTQANYAAIMEVQRNQARIGPLGVLFGSIVDIEQCKLLGSPLNRLLARKRILTTNERKLK